MVPQLLGPHGGSPPPRWFARPSNSLEPFDKKPCASFRCIRPDALKAVRFSPIPSCADLHKSRTLNELRLMRPAFRICRGWLILWKCLKYSRFGRMREADAARIVFDWGFAANYGPMRLLAEH